MKGNYVALIPHLPDREKKLRPFLENYSLFSRKYEGQGKVRSGLLRERICMYRATQLVQVLYIRQRHMFNIVIMLWRFQFQRQMMRLPPVSCTNIWEEYPRSRAFVRAERDEALSWEGRVKQEQKVSRLCCAVSFNSNSKIPETQNLFTSSTSNSII